MTVGTLARITPGHYLGVGYEAKGMFGPTGGFKAGYRFNAKDDWTWGEGKFETLDEAVDGGCALAREAISSGRHVAHADAP